MTTTATTHIEHAEQELATAARSLALALQHDPATVMTLNGFQRELLLRHGLKRSLIEAERAATRTPLDSRLTKRPKSRVDPVYANQRSRLKLKK